MKMVLSRLGNLQIIPNPPDSPIPARFEKVNVLACAICRTDAKMWAQGHRDLALPRVLGHEMAVENDRKQRFVVWPGKSCGTCIHCKSGRENLCDDMKITGFHMDGGFADTAIIPSDSLIPVPADLDPFIACFAEPVACVINAFEKLNIEPGKRILVIGGGTMGLITALYAESKGLKPFVLEKNEDKFARIMPCLSRIKIPCEKDTHDSEFEYVINTCADHIAFCQSIVKAAKGGQFSFFSGIAKNEHIETNLINLLHYKEIKSTGVYGMTRAHMQKALPFMTRHQEILTLLIEDIISPQSAPDLMPKVLSGKYLKFILDFTGRAPQKTTAHSPADQPVKRPAPEIDPDRPGSRVIRQITGLPEDLRSKAQAKIDDKTKPLGALGRLEPLAVQMCRIQNTLSPAIRNKHLFVFAGDHGVTEEGVSAYPSEVTAQMVENFLNGGAAINVLCRHHDIGMKVVDMGVKFDFKPHNDLIDKKVAKGTNNFTIEDAKSREQMFTALENGMSVFLDVDDKDPVDIVGVGEMGIGNTTSAAAIICAATGITPEKATGRGTGIDDKGLSHKIEVIDRVLAFHQVNPANGFEILQKLGGYEIAGIAGAVLAAASRKCAVVLDGVISTAAGLVAYLIQPDIRGYLISGHKSIEPSQKAALDVMGLTPLIDFDMRLGEGTGAALAIEMADVACKIMCEMASFDDAKVARSDLYTVPLRQTPA